MGRLKALLARCKARPKQKETKSRAVQLENPYRRLYTQEKSLEELVYRAREEEKKEKK